MDTRHLIGAALMTALGVLASTAHAQQSVRTGQLLVAKEGMSDRNFDESVVLVIHHDDSGTLGVVINRPTSLEPAEHFAELDYLHDFAGPVYYGGPVAPTRVLLVLRSPPPGLENTAPLFDDLVVSGDPDVLRGKESAAKEGRLRIYAGHAEWAPGQLDQEVAAGDWQVINGSADLVLTDEPLTLWNRALLLNSDVVVDLRTAAPASQPAAATALIGISSSLAFKYSSVISPRLAMATALSRAARASSSMSGISSLTR